MVSSEVPLLSPCLWNCGSNTSTLRYSLLDIKVTPYRGTTQPATVVRVQIQPRDPISGRQHDAQLQLCVPQVAPKEPWLWSKYVPARTPWLLTPLTDVPPTAPGTSTVWKLIEEALSGDRDGLSCPGPLLVVIIPLRECRGMLGRFTEQALMT